MSPFIISTNYINNRRIDYRRPFLRGNEMSRLMDSFPTTLLVANLGCDGNGVRKRVGALLLKIGGSAGSKTQL